MMKTRVVARDERHVTNDLFEEKAPEIESFAELAVEPAQIEYRNEQPFDIGAFEPALDIDYKFANQLHTIGLRPPFEQHA